MGSRVSKLLLLTLLAAPLVAADPRIDHLSAIAHGSKVTVRFALSNAFRDNAMVESLQSGLPTSFTYEVELYRDRPNWFDEGIGRTRIEVICTFNSVTREYLLNYRRDKKLVRSETFTDLATLQAKMTSIEEPDLFDIGSRKPYKLKVRARADLTRGWLFYLVPWEISTRWREARVRSSTEAVQR